MHCRCHAPHIPPATELVCFMPLTDTASQCTHLEQALLVGTIPYADHAIAAAGGKGAIGWVEGDGVDGVHLCHACGLVVFAVTLWTGGWGEGPCLFWELSGHLSGWLVNDQQAYSRRQPCTGTCTCKEDVCIICHGNTCHERADESTSLTS